MNSYDKRIAKLFENGQPPVGGNSEPGPKPGDGEKPSDDDGADKDDDGGKGETPTPDPAEIKIGEINIKGIEQSFKEIKKEDLERAERSLSTLQPQIAELYARNRRLIVGGNNRADFERVKGEYGEVMDQYLRLKTGEVFENEKHALGERLEQKLDELKADIETKLTEFSKTETDGTHKTQEEVDAEKEKLIKEAEKAVKEWYDKEYKGIKTKVNVEFLNELIKQEADLEKATINALDNGSFCRRFVSKVLNNKALKGALVVASATGLAFTGVGLATGLAVGTMAVGLNFTGTGVALGATRGGLGAALMSRQDSRTSRVRGFASRENIAEQISEMDVTGENADVQGVSSWLMGQYAQANRQDRSSNRKRTAVSAGIGALLGGLASGLHFDKTIERTSYSNKITGRTPIEYKPQYGAENVDVAPNHGFLQIYEQVGGDPANSAQWDEAFKITEQIAQKYNIVSAMDKGVISHAGAPELLPGKPSTWDTTSQQFLNDIINTWASKGLIPTTKTGGEAIWSKVAETVPIVIKNSIMGYLTRATADVTGAAIGGIIGGAGRRGNSINGAERPVITENIAIDRLAESYNNLLDENYPEEDLRWSIIGGLAKTLSYPGNFNPNDDIEASFENLSDERKRHLESLYNQVVAEAAAKKAAIEPESNQ